MGLFSIDIERFYDELVEKGQQLKGIFCIQYPIYCIHANIIDVTPDPLDNLDRAIVEFLIAKPDFTPFQIASLMGTSKVLIEQRISKLLSDDLIIEEDNNCLLSSLGVIVFKEKKQVRQHKQSYDFYLDGLTLKPLPKIFYGYYSSRFISEHDTYYRTIDKGDRKGETYLVRPFGPDLVHTPPEKNVVVDNIFNIEEIERTAFAVPQGLSEINDISFTKLTLQLLVSVSSDNNVLTKQVIDGFALYSLSDNISYYDALRRNILSFENNIKDKIDNLEFKINIPSFRADRSEQPKPIITSNWQEIDKYKSSQNKCFSISSEDLIRVIGEIFMINPVIEESIINEDNEIVINIDKKMLLNSPNRHKLINDMIRQRDYKFSNVDNNVFLLFIYFISSDEFVNKVVHFKKILTNSNPNEVNNEWIKKNHPAFAENFRQLLIASGEYEILEKLDIEKFMIKLN
jgi:hypothetical protein